MKCDSDKIEHKSATEQLQLAAHSLSLPYLKWLSTLVLLNVLWPSESTLRLWLDWKGYLKVRILQETLA